MKIKRATAVALLTELGLKTAEKLSDKRLLAKLKEVVPKADEEDQANVTDKDAKKLMKAILADEDELDEAEILAAAEKVVKKTKSKKEEPEEDEDEDESDEDESDEDEESDDEEEDSEEEDEEEEDDEDSDEDEESDEDTDDDDETDETEESDDETDETEESDEDEEDDVESVKTKKKGKGKKESKADKKDKAKGKKKSEPKGPGVIATILTILTEKASKEKPLSKEKIVSHLAKAFPDREEKALASTVSQQVPTKLRNEKGINIVKHEKGYYIGAKAKAEKSKKKAG